MPLTMVRNDITKMRVDAVVNAANASLLGGGGVDGAIHSAAGPQLLEACRALHGCRTGEAKITPGYRLPCRYVIHTVGPIWQDGRHGEPALLASCYRRSLELAEANGCASIAFPLISAGAYGYPLGQALRVATDTIAGYLLGHEMEVILVVFGRDAVQLGSRLFPDIAVCIDDAYVQSHSEAGGRKLSRRRQGALYMEEERAAAPFLCDTAPFSGDAAPFPCSAAPSRELDERLGRLDEGFSQMLLRKIDEKHMTDAACYRRANIDRRLFHKIKSNPGYRPEKTTVLAFAIALELPLEETREMLMKAGFALSHSTPFDIIVEYFIERGNYNVFEINEALFAFDQSLIGG